MYFANFGFLHRPFLYPALPISFVFVCLFLILLSSANFVFYVTRPCLYPAVPFSVFFFYYCFRVFCVFFVFVLFFVLILDFCRL